MKPWLGTFCAPAFAGVKARVSALAAIAAITTVASGHAAAGETPAPASAAAQEKPAAPEPSIYDRIWGYPKLYSNSKNPWIQELSIVGRQQVDFYHFEGTFHVPLTDPPVADSLELRDSTADNFVNRRTRIGFKAKVLQTFTVHTEVDINLEGDGETYNKLTDAYVKWSPEKWFNLTVGKHGAKFTLDGGTSSTQLITIDRSNIANNFWFPEEYVPGVSVSGDIGKWFYNAGVFTAGRSNREFGDFTGDAFVLTSGGYDLAALIGADKAPIRLDYVYQNPDPDNVNFTRAHEHVLSLNFQGEKGPWGLYADIDYSNGFGSQSDLVGGQITPSLEFCETWQAVARYTGISSDDDNGIRFARYENRVAADREFAAPRGDEYHEIYLGLNKYFYGHKLKWQTGIQYASMKDQANDGGDYHGWGLTTGLRASW